MVTLLRREFTVNAPLEASWQHLARVEEWPSWAKHIRRVELTPSRPFAADSEGVIYLSNGVRSAFRMTEFSPPRNWKWVGRFLWLTVHYDHRFEPVDLRTTKLTWVVEAEGFGVSVFGRLFAKVYNSNLDRAIPLLVEQLNTDAGPSRVGSQ